MVRDELVVSLGGLVITPAIWAPRQPDHVASLSFRSDVAVRHEVLQALGPTERDVRAVGRLSLLTLRSMGGGRLFAVLLCAGGLSTTGGGRLITVGLNLTGGGRLNTVWQPPKPFDQLHPLRLRKTEGRTDDVGLFVVEPEVLLEDQEQGVRWYLTTQHQRQQAVSPSTVDCLIWFAHRLYLCRAASHRENLSSMHLHVRDGLLYGCVGVRQHQYLMDSDINKQRQLE
jgi:hypothetical protein